MTQPSLVFKFTIACALCGAALEWENELGSQPKDDGSETFDIAIRPHTCELQELKELCRMGPVGSSAPLAEDELWEVLTTKAARVGWHPEEVNDLFQKEQLAKAEATDANEGSATRT